jgi:CRP/FNR family transcriptional regulator
MKIAIQQLPPAGGASAGESAAPREGCASCPLIKACLPSNFNQREIQLFENVVAGKRRIARHASLFRKHDRLGMLYAVRFGQFKLIRGDHLGEQRVAGFHMAGDLVGLDGIATGRHDFRLMALENSEVCEIPFAALASVMSVEPAIQRKFLQAMSAAIISEHDHSILLSTTSLDERFATFLIRYGEKYARLGYSDKSFRLSMSRGDIGSYIGTTVESVSRLIARFNAQGAVSIDGRAVTLHDRDYLYAVMAGDGPALARAEAQRATSAAFGAEAQRATSAAFDQRLGVGGG